MKRFSLPISFVLIFMLIVMVEQVWAEKPSWSGNGKGNKDGYNKKNDWKHDDRDNKHEYKEKRERDERHRYFTDQHRAFIHDYFADYYRKGPCPPGLAKKHNGCMPPGQAKKWAMGRPLPRGVIFYDLPPHVLAYLGPPPHGHRFVRVATDILLIAIGTGIVVDAIDDLSWEFNH